MTNETVRRDAFKRSPILESFLATALQDLQYSEADEACTEERDARDSGTIYDCPDATFATARAMVARFESECAQAIAAAGELEPGVEGFNYARHYMTPDRIGSRLYLSCVGSGVGFLDDGNADCLETMEAWARANRIESPYFGDDDKAYFA